MPDQLLLVLLLAAFSGALAGWLGGVGGRWTLRARLLDLERFAEGLDRRVKGREGQAGQAVRQAVKGEQARVEAEAAALLGQMQRAAPRAGPRPVPDDPAAASAEAHKFWTAHDGKG